MHHKIQGRKLVIIAIHFTDLNVSYTSDNVSYSIKQSNAIEQAQNKVYIKLFVLGTCALKPMPSGFHVQGFIGTKMPLNVFHIHPKVWWWGQVVVGGRCHAPLILSDFPKTTPLNCQHCMHYVHIAIHAQQSINSEINFERFIHNPI